MFYIIFILLSITLKIFTLPIDVIKDIVTLGGKNKSEVLQKIKSIKADIDDLCE